MYQRNFITKSILVNSIVIAVTTSFTIHVKAITQAINWVTPTTGSDRCEREGVSATFSLAVLRCCCFLDQSSSGYINTTGTIRICCNWVCTSTTDQTEGKYKFGDVMGVPSHYGGYLGLENIDNITAHRLFDPIANVKMLPVSHYFNVKMLPVSHYFNRKTGNTNMEWEGIWITKSRCRKRYTYSAVLQYITLYR